MKHVRVFPLAAVFLAAALAFGQDSAASPKAPGMPSEIQRLYDAGHYREVVNAIENALNANAQDASLNYWLGRSFYELHDYSRAISSLERAIALNPDLSEYHEWLGRACGRKAEETHLFAAFTSLALARRTNHEFAAAVRLDPANLDAQRDLIRYLLNAPGIVGGSEEHAQEQIKALASVDSVEADLARAELLATDKKFNDAGDQYQRILAAKPARLGDYLEIAEYYRGREDAAHVEQTVTLAAVVSPDDPRVAYYRGVALVMARKDPARAQQCLQGYLAKVPDRTDLPSRASAHEWLGKLYADEGKPDQAVAEYQAALALDPRDKVARDALRQLEKH